MALKKESILVAFCYLTLYIVWGATYFFIKMAVETIPPFYVVAGRFIVGGPLLLGLAALTGRLKQRPTWREIGASILLGSLLLIGGNGLVTLGEKQVDSYIAALVVACTPMLVAFYDLVLLNKKIPLIQLGGIAVGIAGVGLLLYNGHSLRSSLSPHVLMVVGGIASWGLATSLGHRIKTHPDSMVNSGVQMLFVGVFVLAANLVFGPAPAEFLPQVSLQSALALLFLALIGSLAFGAFNYLVAHEPAIRVVSYALINPVIATLLGLFVGGETVAPFLALGLPLILVGVTLMLYGQTILRWTRLRWPPAVDRRPPTAVDESPTTADCS